MTWRLFHKVLDQRFPENQILSHDLLEGCYLRSGFLSDVPLYENSPGNYLTDVKRRHRWIRGDWQIAGWVWRKGMSGLSRWKIFDNLRRSLVADSSGSPAHTGLDGIACDLVLVWRYSRIIAVAGSSRHAAGAGAQTG